MAGPGSFGPAPQAWRGLGYNVTFNYDWTSVRPPFVCNSTALRPFDDLHVCYDRAAVLWHK